MNRHRAIADQLTRGLMLVGVLGGLVLTAVLLVDVDQLADRHRLALRGWAEIADYEMFVILSFAVTIAAMIGAARRVVLRALAPLRDSVVEIEAAVRADRGFQLDVNHLPLEVATYGGAINRLLARLEAVAVQRETFAAVVAHELKNPMAVVILELEAIGTGEAARIKADVRRMSRLIDQLLVLAQLEAHATSPTRVGSINLADVANEVVAAMRPDAVAQGRQLDLAIGANRPIRGRHALVAAALRNLIENGLRVTPAGGRVAVAVGPGTMLSVSDGGPGLTAEQLRSLSEPFAQAHLPSSAGGGLGLAIVDQVARLHHAILETDPAARTIIVRFQHRDKIPRSRNTKT